MQQEVQWGAREMAPDMRERLRQYIAGRAEMATGDRMVLRALTAQARERERFWLGVPLIAVAGVIVACRRRRYGRLDADGPG
jgi:hypothetical protein